LTGDYRYVSLKPKNRALVKEGRVVSDAQYLIGAFYWLEDALTLGTGVMAVIFEQSGTAEGFPLHTSSSELKLYLNIDEDYARQATLVISQIGGQGLLRVKVSKPYTGRLDVSLTYGCGDDEYIFDIEVQGDQAIRLSVDDVHSPYTREEYSQAKEKALELLSQVFAPLDEGKESCDAYTFLREALTRNIGGGAEEELAESFSRFGG
jgi:hypothetical protein